MMDNLAYIGFGSNIGDKEYNCHKALGLLDTAENTLLVNRSRLYWTEPVDVEGQEWFVNGAAALKTSLKPKSLLSLLMRIEAEMGRVRLPSKAPRIIDLDLLFFNNEVIKSPGLTVPHPRIQERKFVLIPLCDIAPNFVHPDLNLSITHLLKNCKDHSTVELLKK